MALYILTPPHPPSSFKPPILQKRLNAAKSRHWFRQRRLWNRALLGPIKTLTTQHSAASELCSRERDKQQLGAALRLGERRRAENFVIILSK